jgi:hypothetical protein
MDNVQKSIVVIKSRWIRRQRHVARMGTGERNAYRILVGKSKERNHVGDLEIGGRIMLK